jgi:hypothetical protein
MHDLACEVHLIFISHNHQLIKYVVPSMHSLNKAQYGGFLSCAALPAACSRVFAVCSSYGLYVGLDKQWLQCVHAAGSRTPIICHMLRAYGQESVIYDMLCSVDWLERGTRLRCNGL